MNNETHLKYYDIVDEYSTE
ncbi:MAG: DUF2543 family protein [Symbiopectobacterium sp.]